MTVALRVAYRPVERDLADGSTHYGDERTIDLVDFEEVGGGEYSGRHIVGEATDGRDVVVFLGSGRVRARGKDFDGTFEQFLGYADELRGVSV